MKGGGLMIIHEFYIKVYCLQDITKIEVTIQISKLIDSLLMKNEDMQVIHTSRTYKPYCFGGLMPLESDGIYKRGNIYTFVLRTVDEKLAQKFRTQLPQQYTKTLKVLTAEEKQIKKRPIEKIFTLTPVIMKFDNGYWKTHYSEEIFEKRLRENMIKKYNTLSQTKLDEDFELFQYIKFDNQKPIAFHCKNITLLGDKVTLGIATNPVAQQLAYMTIGTALGELNARGAGFIGYKYL